MSLYLVAANCENLPELDWWKTVKCRMSVSKVSETGKKTVVYDKEIDKRKFDWSVLVYQLLLFTCAYVVRLDPGINSVPFLLPHACDCTATIWIGAGRSLYLTRMLQSCLSSTVPLL